MKSIINVLEKIRKSTTTDNLDSSGIIIGKKWFLDEKVKLTKCYVSSRLTRKIVAQAAQEKVRLIILIFPPILTRGHEQKIDDEQLDLLKIIIENKIVIYALGENWLTSEDGGFDFFFDLLEFQYKSNIKSVTIDHNNGKNELVCRLGQRKKKLKLSELLFLLQQFVDKEITYLGYNELPVQKAIIFHDILDKGIIQEINQAKVADLVIVGEVNYEALLAAQLAKLPLVIIGKRNLENMLISKIRRKLMEEVTIDLPDIIVKKQEEIGTKYDT
jgi:putative NIF3 family GTP cyclohydrolase 1 type 2